MDVTKTKGRATGNRECIALLKKYLREARRGYMAYAAIAVALEPDQIGYESVGSVGYQADILGAITKMRDGLESLLAARMAPVDPNAPAHYVTFNAANHVVNYDFICWLLGAEMARRRAGASKPLEVSFFHPEQSATDVPEIQRQMLQQVVGPMVGLVGGKIGPLRGGRTVFSMTYNEIVAAHGRGEEVPKLQVPPMAAGAVDALLDGLPAPIVITLREAKHYETRNSNLEAWLKFAAELQDKGENVLFVRDTAKAEEPLGDFATMPIASQSLHMRAALYARAKANLFVANGPACLAFHLGPPFLMFSEMDPEHKGIYQPAWPEWWIKHQGVTVGSQFPWFAEDQRIIWETDTYSNISRAWEALQGASNGESDMARRGHQGHPRSELQHVGQV